MSRFQGTARWTFASTATRRCDLWRSSTTRSGTRSQASWSIITGRSFASTCKVRPCCAVRGVGLTICVFAAHPQQVTSLSAALRIAKPGSTILLKRTPRSWLHVPAAEICCVLVSGSINVEEEMPGQGDALLTIDKPVRLVGSGCVRPSDQDMKTLAAPCCQ